MQMRRMMLVHNKALARGSGDLPCGFACARKVPFRRYIDSPTGSLHTAKTTATAVPLCYLSSSPLSHSLFAAAKFVGGSSVMILCTGVLDLRTTVLPLSALVAKVWGFADAALVLSPTLLHRVRNISLLSPLFVGYQSSLSLPSVWPGVCAAIAFILRRRVVVYK